MSGVRVVSAFLIFAFISQEIGWTAAVVEQPARNAPSAITSIPTHIGLVKDSFQGASRETIINIKDIHDNFSAQQSIAALLDNLLNNYQIKIIGTEGAEGPVDVSILSAFPDESIRQKVGQRLMREGTLSAGELVAALRKEPVGLYGMDKRSLYDDNLVNFQKVLRDQKSNSDMTESFLAELRRLEEAVYSEPLKRAISNGVLSVNGGVSFTERWKFLAGMADQHQIAYAQEPNISKLLKCGQLEKQINFEKANSERQTLLDLLAKRMTKERLDALLLEGVHYKLGRLSQAGFSSYMLEAAKKENVDLSGYSQLQNFADYMTAYEAIDIDALKEEVDGVESQLLSKIVKSEDEKRLLDIHKKALILRDMFGVKLGSTGLAYYKEAQNEFAAPKFKAILDPLAKKYKVQAQFSILVPLFERVPGVMRFYDSAEARNRVLLDNMVKMMRSKGQTVGCLITGGFHSRGITDIMRSDKVSHLVILPRFNKDAKRPYLTIITNIRHTEKDFAYSKEVLETKMRATAYLFAQGAHAIIKKNSGKDTNVLQALIDKETERLKMLYMNNFRGNQRRLKENNPGFIAVDESFSKQADKGRTSQNDVTSAPTGNYIATPSLLGGAPLVDGLKVQRMENNVLNVSFRDGSSIAVTTDTDGNIQSGVIEGPLAKEESGKAQTQTPREQAEALARSISGTSLEVIKQGTDTDKRKLKTALFNASEAARSSGQILLAQALDGIYEDVTCSYCGWTAPDFNQNPAAMNELVERASQAAVDAEAAGQSPESAADAWAESEHLTPDKNADIPTDQLNPNVQVTASTLQQTSDRARSDGKNFLAAFMARLAATVFSNYRTSTTASTEASTETEEAAKLRQEIAKLDGQIAQVDSEIDALRKEREAAERASETLKKQNADILTDMQDIEKKRLDNEAALTAGRNTLEQKTSEYNSLQNERELYNRKVSLEQEIKELRSIRLESPSIRDKQALLKDLDAKIQDYESKGKDTASLRILRQALSNASTYKEFRENVAGGSEDQWRDEHRKFAREFHPDLNPGDQASSNLFKLVQQTLEAFEKEKETPSKSELEKQIASKRDDLKSVRKNLGLEEKIPTSTQDIATERRAQADRLTDIRERTKRLQNEIEGLQQNVTALNNAVEGAKSSAALRQDILDKNSKMQEDVAKKIGDINARIALAQASKKSLETRRENLQRPAAEAAQSETEAEASDSPRLRAMKAQLQKARESRRNERDAERVAELDRDIQRMSSEVTQLQQGERIQHLLKRSDYSGKEALVRDTVAILNGMKEWTKLSESTIKDQKAQELETLIEKVLEEGADRTFQEKLSQDLGEDIDLDDYLALLRGFRAIYCPENQCAELTDNTMKAVFTDELRLYMQYHSLIKLQQRAAELYDTYVKTKGSSQEYAALEAVIQVLDQIVQQQSGISAAQSKLRITDPGQAFLEAVATNYKTGLSDDQRTLLLKNQINLEGIFSRLQGESDALRRNIPANLKVEFERQTKLRNSVPLRNASGESLEIEALANEMSKSIKEAASLHAKGQMDMARRRYQEAQQRYLEFTAKLGQYGFNDSWEEFVARRGTTVEGGLSVGETQALKEIYERVQRNANDQVNAYSEARNAIPSEFIQDLLRRSIREQSPALQTVLARQENLIQRARDARDLFDKSLRGSSGQTRQSTDQYREAKLLFDSIIRDEARMGLTESFEIYQARLERETGARLSQEEIEELRGIYQSTKDESQRLYKQIFRLQGLFPANFIQQAQTGFAAKANPKTPASAKPGYSDKARERLNAKDLNGRLRADVRTRIQNSGFVSRWSDRFVAQTKEMAGKFFAAGALAPGRSYTSQDTSIVQDLGVELSSSEIGTLKNDIAQALRDHPQADTLSDTAADTILEFEIAIKGKKVKFQAANVHGSVLVVSSSLLKGVNLQAREYFDLLSLGMAIEDTNLDGLNQGIDSPYVILGLDKSAYLFEDHRKNGIIGVNHAGLMAGKPSISSSQKALLVMGILHELYHEARPEYEQRPDLLAEFEASRLAMDVELSITLADSLGIPLDALVTEMQNVFKNAGSVYADALQDVYEGLIATGRVAPPAVETEPTVDIAFEVREKIEQVNAAILRNDLIGVGTWLSRLEDADGKLRPTGDERLDADLERTRDAYRAKMVEQASDAIKLQAAFPPADGTEHVVQIGDRIVPVSDLMRFAAQNQIFTRMKVSLFVDIASERDATASPEVTIQGKTFNKKAISEEARKFATTAAQQGNPMFETLLDNLAESWVTDAFIANGVFTTADDQIIFQSRIPGGQSQSFGIGFVRSRIGAGLNEVFLNPSVLSKLRADNPAALQRWRDNALQRIQKFEKVLEPAKIASLNNSVNQVYDYLTKGERFAGEFEQFLSETAGLSDETKALIETANEAAQWYADEIGRGVSDDAINLRDKILEIAASKGVDVESVAENLYGRLGLSIEHIRSGKETIAKALRINMRSWIAEKEQFDQLWTVVLRLNDRLQKSGAIPDTSEVLRELGQEMTDANFSTETLKGFGLTVQDIIGNRRALLQLKRQADANVENYIQASRQMVFHKIHAREATGETYLLAEALHETAIRLQIAAANKFDTQKPTRRVANRFENAAQTAGEHLIEVLNFSKGQSALKGWDKEFLKKKFEQVESMLKSKAAQGEKITDADVYNEMNRLHAENNAMGDVSIASWLRDKFQNNKDKMEAFDRIDAELAKKIPSDSTQPIDQDPIDFTPYAGDADLVLYYTEKLFDAAIEKEQKPKNTDPNKRSGFIKADQRYLFFTFLGQLRSGEMEAGGGKTDAALFFLQVAGVLSPNASRLLIVNSADAASKFVTGSGPAGSREKFAKLFGANLVDGSALQSGGVSGGYSGKEGFVKAVQDKHNIVIIDFTALGHLHNESIDVVNAVKQFNLIVVDEAHLPVTGQQAYIVAGEEDPYVNTSQGRARLEAWKKFYDRVFNGTSDGIQFTQNAEDLNSSDQVPVLFVPGEEAVKEGKSPRSNKAAARLFKNIMSEYGQDVKEGEFFQFLSAVANVNANREKTAKGYAVSEGKIYPVDQYGSISWNSRISDVNYKIGLALAHNAKHGIKEGTREFAARGIDLNLIGKANTTNYTSLLQIFAKQKAVIVGMTATASGKKALIEAGIGSPEGGFVKITTSVYDRTNFEKDAPAGAMSEQDILDLTVDKINDLEDLKAANENVWKFVDHLLSTINGTADGLNGQARSVIVASVNSQAREKLTQLMTKILGASASSRLETIDAVTDKKMINTIADYAAPGTDKDETKSEGYNKFGPKIIIANEQAFTGVDFRGVIDLHVLGADNFTEDNLAQLTFRTGRTTAQRDEFVDAKSGRYLTNRYIYANNAKIDKQLAEWKANEKFMDVLLEQFVPAWDGTGGDARGIEYLQKLISDANDFTMEEKLELVIKIRNAIERSNAIEFALADTLRGRMIINELRGRIDRLKEMLENPRLSAARKRVLNKELAILDSAFIEVINHDSTGSLVGGGGTTQVQTGEERARAIFGSIQREALDVFSKLSEKLESVGKSGHMKDAIDMLVEDYAEINFDRVAPARGNDSFSKAKTAEDVLAVAKRLMKQMLPKKQGSAESLTETQAKTVGEALKEVKATPAHAATLRKALHNEKYVRFENGVATEELTLAGRKILGVYQLVVFDADEGEDYRPLASMMASLDAKMTPDDYADVVAQLFSKGILGTDEDALRALKTLNEAARIRNELGASTLILSDDELRRLATEKYDPDLAIHDMFLKRGIGRGAISRAMATTYTLLAREAERGTRKDTSKNYMQRASRVMALSRENSAEKYRKFLFMQISGQADRDRQKDQEKLQALNVGLGVLERWVRAGILGKKDEKKRLLETIYGKEPIDSFVAASIDRMLSNDLATAERGVADMKEAMEKSFLAMRKTITKKTDPEKLRQIHSAIDRARERAGSLETYIAYRRFEIQSRVKNEQKLKQAVTDLKNHLYQYDKDFKDAQLEEHLQKFVETLQKNRNLYPSKIAGRVRSALNRAVIKIEKTGKNEAQILNAEISAAANTLYADEILRSSRIRTEFDADEFLGVNVAGFVNIEERINELKKAVKNVADNPKAPPALQRSANEFLKAVDSGNPKLIDAAKANFIKALRSSVFSKKEDRESMKVQRSRLIRIATIMADLKAVGVSKLAEIRGIAGGLKFQVDPSKGVNMMPPVFAALNAYMKDNDFGKLTMAIAPDLTDDQVAELGQYAQSISTGSGKSAEFEAKWQTTRRSDAARILMARSVIKVFFNARRLAPEGKREVDLGDFLAYWAGISGSYNDVLQYADTMNRIFETQGDFDEASNQGFMPLLRFDTVEENDPDPEKVSFYAVNFKKIISQKEDVSSVINARTGQKVSSRLIYTRQIDFLETYHPDIYQRTDSQGKNVVIANLSGAGQYVENTLLPQIRRQRRTSTGKMERLVEAFGIEFKSSVSGIVEDLIDDIFLSHEFQHVSDGSDPVFQSAIQGLQRWMGVGEQLYSRENAEQIYHLAQGFITELTAHLRSAFENSQGQPADPLAALFVLYQLDTYLTAPQLQHYKEVSRFVFQRLADAVNANAKSKGLEEPLKGQLSKEYDPIDVIDAARSIDSTGRFAQDVMKGIYTDVYSDASKFSDIGIDVATKFFKKWKTIDYTEQYENVVNTSAEKLDLSKEDLAAFEIKAETIAHKARVSVAKQGARPSNVAYEILGDLNTLKDALPARDSAFEQTRQFINAAEQAEAALRHAYGAAVTQNGGEAAVPYPFPNLKKKFIAIREDKWNDLIVYVPDEDGELKVGKAAGVSAIQLFGADVILIPAKNNYTENQLLGLMLHEGGHLIGVDFVDHDLREGLTEWRARELLRDLKGNYAVDDYMKLSSDPAKGLYADEVKKAQDKYKDLSTAQIDLARFSGDPIHLEPAPSGARLAGPVMASVLAVIVAPDDEVLRSVPLVSGARLLGARTRTAAEEILAVLDPEGAAAHLIIDLKDPVTGTRLAAILRDSVQEEESRRISALYARVTRLTSAEANGFDKRELSRELDQALGLLEPINWDALLGGETLTEKVPTAIQTALPSQTVERWGKAVQAENTKLNAVLKVYLDQKGTQRNVLALTADALFLPDGSVDPLFLKSATVLAPQLMNYLSFFYDAEALRRRDRVRDAETLEKAGLGWLAKRAVVLDGTESLVRQLEKKIPQRNDRPITVLLGDQGFAGVRESIKPDAPHRFVVLPTETTGGPVITGSQKLAVSLIADSKGRDIKLIAVGAPTLWTPAFAEFVRQNRSLTALLAVPIRIFEEIQKVLRALQSTDISA